MAAAEYREVICLQLGQYASCVGAHWWNLQETQRIRRPDSEICSDIQFRAGLTPKGAETYTPRLIILDTKGGACSVRVTGDSEDEEETAQTTPAWRGKIATHREDPNPEGGAPDGGGVGGEEGGGAAQHRKEEPRRPITREGAWSDFLHTRLHPKSLCTLGHRHGGDLESFSQGEAVMSSPANQEEVEERLRFFSEECDYLQGFHLLCDALGGMSGVGGKISETIHDDYPGRGILSLPTIPVLSEKRDRTSSTYQMMNCVMSFVALTNHSSAICPLTLNSGLGRRPGTPPTLPHVLYDAMWDYHSSAVLAAALETLTSPYRLTSPVTMTHVTDALTHGGRKILTAFCSLPFPIGSSSFLPDALLPHMTSPPWRCMSGGVGDAPVFSQSVVLRGIPRHRHVRPLPPGSRPLSSLHACCSEEEILQRYLSAVSPQTLSSSLLLESPCTPSPTFPPIFSRYVTRDGYTEEEPQEESTVVGGVPVMAALSCSASMGRSLCALCDEVTAGDIRRRVNFSAAGIEEEEFRETINDLRTLAQCYHSDQAEDSDDTG